MISDVEKSALICDNTEILIDRLIKVYNKNILEDRIINNQDLIECFIIGKFKFYKSKYNDIEDQWEHCMPIQTLKDFIDMMKKLDKEKTKIIMDSMKNRLKSIDKYEEFSSDDLPF